MMQVTSVVREIVENDPLFYETISQGIANFSGIARAIHQAVEDKTQKAVQVSTIVVALARVAKELKKEEGVYEMVRLNLKNYRVQFPMCQLVFDKNEAVFEEVLRLKNSTREFLSMTTGDEELNVVLTRELAAQLTTTRAPKKTILDLALVTVHFDEKLVYMPGLLHYVMTLFFAKGINVIDVVSTYTELNILISSADVSQAMSLKLVGSDS